MDTQTINTPEKLHQAIVEFLESDYSHEELVETYDDVRKCAIRFRGMPALPACKDKPLDGLQDVMEWCNKASEVVDDIVSNLERQTISEIIRQLKKLREFPSRLFSQVNSNLLEQAQNEAKAIPNETMTTPLPSGTTLMEKARKEAMAELDKLGLTEIVKKCEQEAQIKEETVRIYLSKDPTFKNKLAQLNNEINEVTEKINKLVDNNTPTEKLLDVYCKLKGIPIQQLYDEVGRAYPAKDLTNVIFGNFNRLYTSIDNVIKIFEEIQTKAKKRTSIFNKDFFNNFIKATIKHLPYVGPYLFDVIYGVDGVKSQKKERNDPENKKLTKKEHKSSSVKRATKDKRGSEKWYQSRAIQAALITGGFMLVAAVLTTPLWTPFINKLFGGSGNGTKISTALKTSGKSSPAIITGGPNSPVTINYNSPRQGDLQEKGRAIIGEGGRLTDPEKTEVNQPKPPPIVKIRDKVIPPEETGGEVNQFEPSVALLEIYKADSVEAIPDLPVIRTYWKRDLSYSGNFLLPDRVSEIGVSSPYVAVFSFYYEAKQQGKYGFTILHNEINSCKLTVGGVNVAEAGRRKPTVQGVCNLSKGFHRVGFSLTSIIGHPWNNDASFQVKILTPDSFDAVILTKDMMLLKK